MKHQWKSTKNQMTSIEKRKGTPAKIYEASMSIDKRYTSRRPWNINTSPWMINEHRCECKGTPAQLDEAWKSMNNIEVHLQRTKKDEWNSIKKQWYCSKNRWNIDERRWGSNDNRWKDKGVPAKKVKHAWKSTKSQWTSMRKQRYASKQGWHINKP